METGLNEKINGYKETLFETKKYWLIYIIFIGISFASTLTNKNFAHPNLNWECLQS
ncbi:hypothetical protein [Methanobrevibacter sp.]|uniref:hypothetical protein n=1 Tax=Methanobrevibacter sp. TaxID=66852 RepID=UPI003890F3A5